MFGLGKHSDKRVCFVVIDIGSGSAGAAIMVSEAGKKHPTYVWSHREYALIRELTATEIPIKEVTTCLINIFLKLGNDGLKTLHSFDPSLHISELQVTVSAPWSYTITKNVSYSDNEPFVITERLLEDLRRAASKDAMEATAESSELEQNGLMIINTDLAGVIANGYTIPHPIGITTKEVMVASTIGITGKQLMGIVTDSKNKVLPRASISHYSFMYVFYSVLQSMSPDTNEACLVDITSEATEIGIIRDGILTHVTHMPIGTYTLARTIAAATDLPKEEAYLFMNGGVSFIENKLSDAKRTRLDETVNAYQIELSDLFARTGDVLAIPKTMFVHTDADTEAFFIDQAERAARITTKSTHSAHPVTSKLLEDETVNDTALILSANFAHSRLQS